MSWHKHIFDRLRDREWHQVGALFEEVEHQIPLHFAMRHTMRMGRSQNNLPMRGEERWLLFLHTVGMIGVESGDGSKRHHWREPIRIRYLQGSVCPGCSGPVIKASWSSRSRKRYHCLACQPIETGTPDSIVRYKIEDKPETPAPLLPPSEPAPPPPPPIMLAGTMLSPVASPPVIQPSPGWMSRARRSFALYLRHTRLPFMSPTKIAKKLARCGDDQGIFLTRYGRSPLTPFEFYTWVNAFMKTHPPRGPP